MSVFAWQLSALRESVNVREEESKRGYLEIMCKTIRKGSM